MNDKPHAYVSRRRFLELGGAATTIALVASDRLFAQSEGLYKRREKRQ
jgi:hypothetical protein